MIGTPSAAKNPGDMVRNRARGIFFAGAVLMSIGGELEPGTEDARVAPRNRCADGNPVYSGQFRNTPDDFPIEPGDLIGSAAIGDDRYVDRQHVARVEAGLRGLQR